MKDVIEKLRTLVKNAVNADEEGETKQVRDAMYPKTVIDPKKVEADLGPVIGDDHSPIGTLDDYLHDVERGEVKPGKMYLLPDESYIRSNIRGDIKPTNPKDAIGSNKLPLHLVPSALNIYASLAFLEGALKYGAGNYRAIGVRFSIYIAALERHLQKVKDGEWADKTTGVPHFSSILACVGIILDAKHCGKLTDDRLPSVPTAQLIQEMEAHVPRLKKQFEHCHPKHYTILDEKEPA